MKILLVSLSNNYDHQLSLYSLFDEMLKSGLDVYTLGINEPKYRISFTSRNLFLDAPKKPGLSFGAFKTKELKRCCQFILKEGFDIAYFESLHIWNVYLFKKIKKHLSIVHSIHDVIPHESKLSFFIKIFNKIIYKNADYVVVRSRNALEYCNSKKRIPKNKIVYLPLGRKWRDYRPCQSTDKVLFFGRITRYKGLENLLTICKELPNTQFLIIGKVIEKKDSDLLNLMKQLSNVTVCDKYVSEEEMIDYFNCSDCVILPYKSATQSGVIVDSYSFSRPCIAFNVGGIKEQIADGQTGFLVSGGLDEFKNRIVQYINSSDVQKEEMCKNAYSFGKDNYSVQQLSIKMMQLFKRICEDRK